MNTKIFCSAIILIGLFSGCCCPGWGGSGVKGSGLIKEESREIGEFTELQLNGAYTVNVTVEDRTTLEIAADDNLLPLIRTRIKGSRLVIDSTESISPSEAIRIEITCTGLEGLECNGAHAIHVEEIRSTAFDLELNGAGTIFLSGETGKYEIDVSGSASVISKDLKAKEVAISIAGAATAHVHAVESLTAKVSGAGTIEYYGNPKNVSTDVSGVGSINRRE